MSATHQRLTPRRAAPTLPTELAATLSLGLYPFTRNIPEALSSLPTRKAIGAGCLFIVLCIVVVILAHGSFGLTVSLFFAGPIGALMAISAMLMELVVTCAVVLGLCIVWAAVAAAGAWVLRLPLPAQEVVRSIALGSGAVAWLLLPLIGTTIMLVVWAMIAMRLAIRAGTRGRASAVASIVMILPPLIIAGLLILNVKTVGSISRTLYPTHLVIPDTAYFETVNLREQLLIHTRRHDGQLPGHAIEMASRYGHFPLLLFSSSTTRTTPSDVRVSAVTLEIFIHATPAQQTEIIERVVADSTSLPDDYRFGDFIFLARGHVIDMDAADLWIIIFSPDPAVNPRHRTKLLTIGTVGRGVIRVPLDEWDARVNEQNDLRARRGLPPLPPLDTLLQ